MSADEAPGDWQFFEVPPGGGKVEWQTFEADGTPVWHRRLPRENHLVQQLANYHSRRCDLEAVAETCEYLMENRATLPELIRQVLWEGAVVTFGRCFVKGEHEALRRGGGWKPPKAILDKLSPDQEALRQRLIGLRHQHVAHVVSDQTNAIVVNGLFRGEKGQDYWQIQTHVFRNGVDWNIVPEVPGLCRTLSAALQHEATNLEPKLAELAKSFA